jgi:hypothetical protein
VLQADRDGKNAIPNPSAAQAAATLASLIATCPSTMTFWLLLPT